MDQNKEETSNADRDHEKAVGNEAQSTSNGNTKFQDLNSARARRDNTVVLGKRIMIGAAGLAVVAGGVFVFLSLNNGPSQQPVSDEPTVSATQATPSIDCDQVQIPAGDSEHPCQFKAQFQERYRFLTTELFPVIEASSQEAFVQTALNDIQETETVAIQAFDRSDFKVAALSVETAITAAEKLKNEIAENFQLAFQQAEVAFHNNDFNNASQSIDRALRLNPQSAEAGNLRQRIAVLPDILSLYKKVAEAEVQNQLLEQYKYMEAILQLDPARQDIASQIGPLGERIKSIRYNDLLREAGQLIDADELNRARTAIKKANAIYPGRGDTASLTRKIDAIEKKRRINSLLSAAKNSEANDNWPDALQRYEQVLTEDASNQQAENGKEKANRIIRANNRAVDILNQQSRMQDPRIHQRITEFVEQIKPMARDSQVLADTVMSLENTLSLWQQKRSITVISDGKSDIKVRRVGNVGKTKSRDIQLKPGNYEFECTRKGYRSNIVKHFVPPDIEKTSVTIVCNVPI